MYKIWNSDSNQHRVTTLDLQPHHEQSPVAVYEIIACNIKYSHNIGHEEAPESIS